MEVIKVLVTGAGGGGIGEQVIKCLKLSELKYHIIATDVTTISRATTEADEFVLVPLAADANYIPFIIDTCIQKKIQVVVPGSEIELKVFSTHRAEFEKQDIALLINSAAIIDICLDKNKTSTFLDENGFLSPTSFAISNESQLEVIDLFPLVLKPSVGGGGSVNTMIVQNKEELKVFGQFLLKQYEEFIAQAYVGDPQSEYTVGVFSLADGNIVDAIVLRRNILSGLGAKTKVLNQTGKTELGKYLAISSGISQGEIIRHTLISETCEAIAKKLGSVGPLNIQCRLVGEKVYIFEINPRFSGTSPMRALAGFNELEIAIKNRVLMQNQFGRIEYKLGHVMRGLVESFV
jgi:carbamoyl-phosphate synthase large subunit